MQEFEKAVKHAACDLKLQPEESFVLKVVQLEELLYVRHSVFIGTFEQRALVILNQKVQFEKVICDKVNLYKAKTFLKRSK